MAGKANLHLVALHLVAYRCIYVTVTVYYIPRNILDLLYMSVTYLAKTSMNSPSTHLMKDSMEVNFDKILNNDAPIIIAT